jgi:hypothetical protein
MERYNQIKHILRENASVNDDYLSQIKHLPSEKQDQIIRLIKSVDEMIELEAHKLGLLKKYRLGLLQKFIPDYKSSNPNNLKNKWDVREGLNLSKRSKTDMGDLFDSALKLLNYSFSDIGWDYSQLTPQEKALISEEDFNRLREICQQTM